MSEGWISLNRTIRDHWLYEKRILSKFEAWVEMLMMANHQDNKFLLGNELVSLKRGQFVTSELKLMDRWGWSKTKVRNFLKLLEEDEMIIKKSDKKKTTLTICNYSLYQDKRTTERPIEDHKKTAERPREDTNNNDNNVNNENNTSIIEFYKTLQLPKVIKITDKRIKSVNARITDYGIDLVKETLVSASESDFLISEMKSSWYNFDWIFNPNNFIKIVEGNYKNKKSETKDNRNGVEIIECFGQGVSKRNIR